MPRTTRKHRGGSRRYADLPDVRGPGLLSSRVDVQYVLSHGFNTLDNFFVVPENTYLYFVAKSGDPANLEDTSNFFQQQSYQSVYDTIFTNMEPKPMEPYPGAHVYVPGDILPMMRLHFYHDAEFPTAYTWPMGVYSLPFTPDVKSYFGPKAYTVMLHLNPLALARTYPTLPRLSVRDAAHEPVEDAEAGAGRMYRSAMLAQLFRIPSPEGRIAYLERLQTNFGLTEEQVYDPHFWFTNVEDVLTPTRNDQAYTLYGNRLVAVRPDYGVIPLDELLTLVPSNKPHRLMILMGCRVPYGEALSEKIALSKRLSSASKEAAVQCVASERRNPVFNLAAVKAAYQHLMPMAARLKAALRTIASTHLTAVWRLHSRFFEPTANGGLTYKTRVPAEALYDAMVAVQNLRPDDPTIDRIEDVEVREAFRDLVEALRGAFHPVAERIQREFATQNRRAAPTTKFLKYTTGRTTRYKKRATTTTRANGPEEGGRPDPTGEQQENRNSSNT